MRRALAAAKRQYFHVQWLAVGQSDFLAVVSVDLEALVLCKSNDLCVKLDRRVDIADDTTQIDRWFAELGLILSWTNS